MATVTENEKSYLFVEGEEESEIEVIDPIPGDVEYTVEECADKAWEVFDTSPDIVRAAFRFAGITSATKAQALDLVEAFKNKEITD